MVRKKTTATASKETHERSPRWAIITLHPSLPSETEQRARARAWGLQDDEIDGEDVAAAIVDDARKVGRTTNWPGALPKRATFIANVTALKPGGGQVFFATPMCVGFGPGHARQTIEALWSAGLGVYVHSGPALYREGDDLTELLARVQADANTKYVSKHRAKKPKAKPKS
jgi:hypothetical protein